MNTLRSWPFPAPTVFERIKVVATKALIKPALLIWTRNRAKVTLQDAAKAAGVTVEDLETWEAGSAAPSLNQLRCLAGNYHCPLAH